MDQLGLVLLGQFTSGLAGRDRKAGQHHELTGEGFGRGDADLGSRERLQHRLALARDRRGRHIDDGDRVHAFRLGVAQRRQRVGGLAGLRDEDGEIAFAQGCLAVAELGGDIDFDRQAREALEPVFCDEAGVASGAAGGDVDAANVVEIERQVHGQRNALGRHVDVACQRVTDHFRLLVDLLGHEVAVIGLVDQRRRGRVPDLVALDGVAVLVVDRRALARQHHPVAIFEIADRVGERAERDGVGAEIHLAVAITDRERRSVAGADHEVVVAGEYEAEREGAAQARQRQLDGFHRLVAAREQIVDEVQHDFGIGLGVEHRSLPLELLAQLAEILDDAIVDHGDALCRVRMGVVDGRLAVGGPARVTDPGRALQGLGFQPLLQVLQLAFGAAALQVPLTRCQRIWPTLPMRRTRP